MSSKALIASLFPEPDSPVTITNFIVFPETNGNVKNADNEASSQSWIMFK